MSKTEAPVLTGAPPERTMEPMQYHVPLILGGTRGTMRRGWVVGCRTCPAEFVGVWSTGDSAMRKADAAYMLQHMGWRGTESRAGRRRPQTLWQCPTCAPKGVPGGL